MSQRARVIVSVALLLGAFGVLHFRSVGEGMPMRKPFDQFPTALGGWKGRDDIAFEPDILRMLKMSDYLMRRYENRDGHSAWLYMAYWPSQRRGNDIHSPKNCLPGGGWEPVEASQVQISVPGSAAPITVNRYLVQKDRQMQLVMYWFQAQGAVVAGEFQAKIHMVRSAILRNRTDGAIVRISSPVYGSVSETTAELTEYVRLLYPILGEYLPR
ncbi:MAG TPA: EpsI family protein [Methylomirabilota bacterium]